MNAKVTRRDFIKTSAGLAAVSLAAGDKALFGKAAEDSATMVVVGSGNGLQAIDKAMSMLKSGTDLLDAVIAGVNIVEDDPDELGVGYGGLPNEDGVVELDASVMYGPTHKAGAVASLRNIKNPSKVARLVMDRTDHVLLVGEGALKFARAHGFKEENLLTDRSREIWLRWKESHSERDNWLPPEKKKETMAASLLGAATTGTVNCLVRDAKADLAGVTTTSGLSWKLAGRVGDSPIIGAGLYVDNEVGAAGSTGRGESNLTTCASFNIVELMDKGLAPEEACLRVLEKIGRKSRLQPRLVDVQGRPNFGLSFYAVNKKGVYGSASFYSETMYAVNDGRTSRLVETAYLYKKKKD
jgi:N4-(beta-N-acetylglucosaminyl)-L-asparaginase